MKFKLTLLNISHLSSSLVSSTASGGGNWQNHVAVGLTDGDLPDGPLSAGAYSPSYSRSPTHNR